MLSVQTAREKILAEIQTLPGERLFLDNALGRILAEDIIAGFDIPPTDNSAMDGYALHHADAAHLPARLPVTQNIPAGQTAAPLAPGQAARIMTGAPIPAGADVVVMREDTREEETHVTILKLPDQHENIRFAGEDIRSGQQIFSRGTRLDAARIGILASLRRSLITCHQQPLVAVLSTGDELADLDEELRPGAISSSNSYTLTNLVRETGAMPLYLGIARDSREDIADKLARAARADLILSSGGVSMGDFDLMKDVMLAPGNQMDFWQVAMKPGKPLAFGRIGGKPVIGLPGNPGSAYISFQQFARPAILKLMGAESLLLPRVTARLRGQMKKKTDRPHYIRGILSCSGGLEVRISGPQGSGILTSMAGANCFIVLPAETAEARDGDMVTCEIFSGLNI